MSALRSQRPMLESKDLQATIQFYSSKLGFEVTAKWEHEGKLQWINLDKDNVEIMFSLSNEHVADRNPALTGSIYYNVDDIDPLWNELKDKCEIVYPIENFEYGLREFAIKDNNGYILNFGMVIEPQTDYEKYFPNGLTLETSRVLLRRLQKSDAEELLNISQSPDLWKYFQQDLSNEKTLRAWINDLLMEQLNRKRVAFVVIEKETGNICGSTSYLAISLRDKRLEIGSTWLGEKYLRTGINRHAKFALLQYAFEKIEFERVEFKTDNLNERSKTAMRKIGCVDEGVFRNHMIMPNNRKRSSAYLSIIKEEWPEVKEKFFGQLMIE